MDKSPSSSSSDGSSSFQRISFVVNPNSGKGMGKTQFERCLPVIRKRLGGRLHRVYYTESAGDGVRKARRAVEEDQCDLLVSCGGDGTLHEVLNGVMDTQTRRARCAIALLPIGTGNDFAKSVHVVKEADKWAANYERIIHYIDDGATATLDVGHVRTTDSEDRNKTMECFFMNEASFGISSAVMNAVNTGSVIINTGITYGVNALWQQLTYKNKNVEIRLNDGKPKRNIQQMCAVFNGEYFGSAMRGGLGAKLTDGKFNVMTLGDVGVGTALSIINKMYKGTHISHSKVTMDDAEVVTALPVNEEDKVFVETDGELFGCLPATMTNVPSVLRVVVPREWVDKI